jgi:hypothetical protein
MRKLVIATAVSSCLIWTAADDAVAQDAVSPGGASVLEPELFPSAYRGRWAPSEAACRDVDGVELIQVYPIGVDYHESGGRLLRVTQSGQPRSIKVRLSYEGEGQFWDGEETWTLSAEGDRLDITIDERKQHLQRCE